MQTQFSSLKDKKDSILFFFCLVVVFPWNQNKLQISSKWFKFSYMKSVI